MRNDRWDRDNPEIEVFDVQVPRAPRARSPRREAGRRRLRLTWRPVSLVVVAVLAAAAVLALADRPITPSPSTASMTAAPTATPVPPTPTTEAVLVPATLGPYWPAQIGLPVITIPAAAARQIYTAPGPSASPDGSATGTYWYDQSEIGGPERITVTEIGGDTQGLFTVPLKKGEMLFGLRTDGAWLAVEVTDRGISECPTSVHWRLLVTRLRADGLPDAQAGGFSEVARGTITGQKIPDQDCPMTPGLAFNLAAGRLAWLDDAKGTSGSSVHVRDLPLGHDEVFALKRHGFGLTVSSEGVAWIESSDPTAWLVQMGIQAAGGSGKPIDWQVVEAAFGDGAPRLVDLGGGVASSALASPMIVLDGMAVVATTYLPDSNTTSIVRSEPAGAPTVIDDGSQRRECRAWDAVSGVLLLTCAWPDLVFVDGGPPVSLGAVWTSAEGLRVVTVGTDVPPQAWSLGHRSAWAVLSGDQGSIAVPLSLLGAP